MDKVTQCYLLNYTKLEVLLVIINAGIALIVLIAVVEHGLAGDALLAPGDRGHLPDSPGGPVPDVATLDPPAVSLTRRATLHLSGTVGVDSSDIIRVSLQSSGKRVGNIIIVRLFPLALHEEAGAFDKLVHGHDVMDGDEVLTGHYHNNHNYISHSSSPSGHRHLSTVTSLVTLAQLSSNGHLSDDCHSSQHKCWTTIECFVVII